MNVGMLNIMMHKEERMHKTEDTVNLHLAAIYLNRFAPLTPHHIGWIEERLGYMTDAEMIEFVRTGKRPKGWE